MLNKKSQQIPPSTRCSNPISWEVKKSQKKWWRNWIRGDFLQPCFPATVTHRGLPRHKTALGATFCTWSEHSLMHKRAQKGLKTAFPDWRTKAQQVNTRKREVQLKCQSSKLFELPFLTAVVGLGMVLLGCPSSSRSLIYTHGLLSKLWEKNRDMGQRAGVQRLLSG